MQNDYFCQAGLKVLVIDWDLEAPGIERFFFKNPEAYFDHPGLIDMLLNYKENISKDGIEDEILKFKPLDDFIIKAYSNESNSGQVSLINAGRRIGAQFVKYSRFVLDFDWKDFYDNWEGELYFNQLREQFNKYADIVLIDTRTGVTEMGGVCTYQLADTVIMFCAPNQQNIDGTYHMALNFASEELKQLRPNRPLNILIVPTRIEDRSELTLLNTVKQEFIEKFSEFLPHTLKKDKESIWNLMVPHVSHYAFKEKVAMREVGMNRSDAMVQAYTSLANEMAKLSPTQSIIHQVIIKNMNRDYDAFLSYDKSNKYDVEFIANKLRDLTGINLYFDSWYITPGDSLKEELRRALEYSKNYIIFIGSNGLNLWQRKELTIAIERQKENDNFHIIPVLLEGADENTLPIPLKKRVWIDFRKDIADRECFRSLVKGIMGISQRISFNETIPPNISKFSILHISDLHIRDYEDFDRSVVLDPLIMRVKEDRKKGIEPEIVVVTGDIAFKGVKKEYDLAKIFFDNLLRCLNLGNDRIFIVPGNHDVNRKKYRPSDMPAYGNMQELNEELTITEYRADLFKGMDEYFNFIEINYPHLIPISKRLVPFVSSYQTNCGKNIGIVGLNSAWMCRKSPDERKIAIGEYQIKTAINAVNNAN